MNEKIILIAIIIIIILVKGGVDEGLKVMVYERLDFWKFFPKCLVLGNAI